MPKIVRQVGLACSAVVVVVCALERAMSHARAEESAKGTAVVHYARDIQPIFAERCFLCHGADEQESGLRLDSFAAATSEAESGSRAVVAGKPDVSELLRRVSSDDEDLRMPPKGKPLSADEIARLKSWIIGGAKYELHWAFRPLSDSKPPQVKRRAWVKNDIDRFVLARLEAEGIAASPVADRYTLIRRLYYDLLGLPPALDEVDKFVADESDASYEPLVDRLLESPHFGERWGRHWLDKARYADSDGYEKDNARPDAWRYRDWVIRAVNNDMPFDQFTREQLAGDLIEGGGPLVHLATALSRQTLTNREGGVDQEEFRVAAVMDRVETLSTVYLGLTVGCARCHSHKYDPITQTEYYRLFAFFNNADETNIKVPKTAAKKNGKAAMMDVRVLTERTKKRRKTHRLNRGDFLQPLDEVQSGSLSCLPPIKSRREGQAADRIDLARWLFAEENPLVARVAANHIWAHLFGEGLVRTPDDFGVRGKRPTHPQLLDALARRYRQLGWSRKAMVKEIVMSATYRQLSRHRGELSEKDPTNHLLARQNRFRVEAELVRDVTLAAAGLLSHKVGGPSVFPPLPPGVAAVSFASNFKWKTSRGEDRYRRGMYTFFKRTAPHPNLINFDCPDANVTNVKRRTSNTPLQALQTLNNVVFIEAAQAMAKRALTEVDGADESRLTHAFRLCVSRPPSKAELVLLGGLLADARETYRNDSKAAAELVGKSAPKDVPPAEAAAWIAVVRIVLNLDEFLTRE